MVYSKLKNNKRGQVQDILIFMVTIFGIAIFAVVMWQVGDGIQKSLGTAGESSLNMSNTFINNSVTHGIDKTAKMGDTLVGLSFIGLLLVLIISAILVPTNIIWTVIYMIVGTIMWFLSVPISNMWESFINNPSMSGMVAEMPLTNQLFSNLPIFTTIILMILIVILYGKRFMFSEGGGGL